MRIPYFDAHCDTPVPVYYWGGNICDNRYQLDLKRLSAYCPCAQVFSICVDPVEDLVGDTQLVLDMFLKQLDKYSDAVSLCLSFADIGRAERAGKIAALISVEGMEKLGCSLESLKRAYDRGVRIVHITWNNDNALSGAARGSGTGLTELGRKFVPAAQSMGVVLDMSHISVKGFWDVLEVAEKPVLAGHSNAEALEPGYKRNLSDGQFSALVKTGGVAGLNFCADFLGLGRDIEAVVDHAEHWLGLGGEKAVCLGGDLDGVDDDQLPRGIEGVQSLDKLYEAMLRRNWSEGLVRDIFYNNLRDFFGRAL